MYQGKHSAQPIDNARRGASPAHDVTPSRRRSARRHGGRPLALLLALILVVGAAAGGTVAWLTQTTQTKNNNFSYGTVSCLINEDFDKYTKSNVTVTNTGNTPAYIRAACIVNWVDAQGNIAANVPADYTYLLSIPGAGWIAGGDGYYYYNGVVEPGSKTEGSLLTCTSSHPADGEYTLSVKVIASAVQATPSTAVNEAWPGNPLGIS